MNFTLNSDSQFTLTCISTGGPATTVTWTRDSITVVGGIIFRTVLDDPETAQYTHTLTIDERLPGLYNCTVTNKISVDSAQLSVQGKNVFLCSVYRSLLSESSCLCLCIYEDHNNLSKYFF